MYLQDLLNVCESRQIVRVIHDGEVIEGNAASMLNLLDKKVLVYEVAYVATTIEERDSTKAIMRVVTKE